MKTTENPQFGPPTWRRWGMYIGLVVLGLLIGRFVWGGAADPHAGHDHEVDANGEIIWTCSMHPQIREDGPGKCPLCGMDLIPASSVTGSLEGPDAYLVRLSAAEMNLANLRTTVVGGGTATAKVDLTGRVAVDERRKSIITAHVSGRVEQLSVDFTGRTVRSGDELARLYSPEVYAAQQELRQAFALKGTQPQLYEAARKKMALWKFTDEQIDQMAESEIQTVSVPVYADQSGTVSQLMVRKGMYVERGEPLLEIDDLGQVWILLDAYEQDLASIRIGQSLVISTDAVPGRIWKATVRFIDPTVDAMTRTVKIRAEVANSDGSLKPDMLVRGSLNLVSGSMSTSITVPSTAILWTGNRSVVYVKAGSDGDGARFRLVDVTLGQKMGDHYEITDGLRLGDEVVTNAAFTLDSAAQLMGLESMMSERVAKPESDPALQTAVRLALEPYFRLKDALIASDDEAAEASSQELKKTWDEIITRPYDSSEHTIWQELRQHIWLEAEKMASATDLASRRKAFQPLSNRVIELLDRYGNNDGILYKQYCPMADSDRGAYWVSKESAIRNPYFGSSMLTCGEVRGSWP